MSLKFSTRLKYVLSSIDNRQNLTSLPLVSNSIDTFKSNPYGAKSLSLTHQTYSKFLAPFLPYAEKPYGYVRPYVSKADSLASDGLMKVERQFPLVTEQPSVIKKTLLDFAFSPLRFADGIKNHVFDTYGAEYKKCGGGARPSSDSSQKGQQLQTNYIAGVKATITTSMVLTSDVLCSISAFLTAKRDQGRDFASQKYHQAQSIASQATRYASERKDEAVKYADGAVKYAQEKGEEVREYAYTTGKEAEEKAKRVKKEKVDKA